MTQREYHARMIILMVTNENRFAKRLAPMINRQFMDVASYIQAGGNSRDVDMVINQQKRKWLELFRIEYDKISADFIKFGLWSYEPILGLKSFNPESKSELGFLDRLRQITNIFRTTKNITTKIIKDGFDSGLTNNEIALKLRKTGRIASKPRSMLIARTETHKLANQSTRQVALSFGVRTEKKWKDAADERVRAWHKNVMNGKWIDTNDYFIVDGTMMLYPGDPAGGMQNNANCRCIALYRRKK